jgi:hypothetical protein
VIAAPPRAKLNAPPNATPPLFLRDTKKGHWLEPLPAHDAVYAQVNGITDDDDETMEQFGVHLRRTVDESKPHNLILDLRHNNGGNTFRYSEVLRTLVAFSTLEGNKVYVLIGRDVYSAACNLSTDIERIVKPVFVGEPTSCTGNQWGDESTFVLPYSGLTGAFSGARWATEPSLGSAPFDRAAGSRSVDRGGVLPRRGSGAGSGVPAHRRRSCQATSAGALTGRTWATASLPEGLGRESASLPAAACTKGKRGLPPLAMAATGRLAKLAFPTRGTRP